MERNSNGLPIPSICTPIFSVPEGVTLTPYNILGSYLMRKFIWGIIFVGAVLLLVGELWNQNRNKEHAYEVYQQEIDERNEKILALEDSISRLQSEQELYHDVVDWVPGQNSNLFAATKEKVSPNTCLFQKQSVPLHKLIVKMNNEVCPQAGKT